MNRLFARMPYFCVVAPLAVIVVLLLATPAAHAGRYELTNGQGVEVCEAYAKSLNTFKPKMPRTCTRNVHPQFADLSKPKWERLDDAPVPDHQALYAKIDRFLWKRDANPVYNVVVTEWPIWKGTPAQRQRAWEHFSINRRSYRGHLSGFFVADLDIDGDDTLEPVYFEQNCGSVFGSILLVLNKDYTDLDHGKTKLVMPHPPRKEAGWEEFRPVKKGDWGVPPVNIERGYSIMGDSLHGAYYDVFLYRNRAYFDLWWSNHPDYHGKSDVEAGRLHVYSAERGKTAEVCTYRFNRTEDQQ